MAISEGEDDSDDDELDDVPRTELVNPGRPLRRMSRISTIWTTKPLKLSTTPIETAVAAGRPKRSKNLTSSAMRAAVAGLMPVPGGMGVAEAGYTVGLQAIGIPSAVAMSTAIAFRLVTFYLPPIWGAFAMRWLRRNAYV